MLSGISNISPGRGALCLALVFGVLSTFDLADASEILFVVVYYFCAFCNDSSFLSTYLPAVVLLFANRLDSTV
jgi:hypothetical protein